jgi:RNA polymerase sigma-70 factor (TIGR02943 family)
MSRSSKKIEDNNPKEWLGEHGDYLFRYALSRVSEREAAEDLVQETLLAALKNYSSFDGKSSVRTWLTGIMRYKIIDHYRQIYRTGKNKVDMESGNVDDFIDKGINKGKWRPERAPKAWSEWPDKSIHEKEFMKILSDCLKDLPEHIATVFKMSQLEELNTKVICKELEISTTNYWVIMHRARNGLRRCLEIRWFGK